jgi:hypothetical protein
VANQCCGSGSEIRCLFENYDFNGKFFLENLILILKHVFQVWIRGTGSVPKCHGSGTLNLTVGALKNQEFTKMKGVNKTCPEV